MRKTTQVVLRHFHRISVSKKKSKVFISDSFSSIRSFLYFLYSGGEFLSPLYWICMAFREGGKTSKGNIWKKVVP